MQQFSTGGTSIVCTVSGSGAGPDNLFPSCLKNNKYIDFDMNQSLDFKTFLLVVAVEDLWKVQLGSIFSSRHTGHIKLQL